MSWDISL